jgi:hypothetical protein
MKISVRAGLGSVYRFDPLNFTPTIMQIPDKFPLGEERLHWTDRFPQRLMPWLAGLLALSALGWSWRAGPVPGRRPLIIFIVACLGTWLAMKAMVAGIAGAITTESWQASMARIYLETVLTRCELVMTFTCLAAACALLYLLARQSAYYWQLAPAGVIALVLATAFLLRSPYQRSGYLLIPVGSGYKLTDEDLELASWLEEQLPPERGSVGLAAVTLDWGPERHIYAFAGAQAVLQYGRHYNFRFGLRSLERKQGYEDYVEHVRETFDPAWCLANDIRCFYVDDRALKYNPGLARAISSKQLKLLRRAGESAVYEVVPPSGEGGVRAEANGAGRPVSDAK